MRHVLLLSSVGAVVGFGLLAGCAAGEGATQIAGTGGSGPTSTTTTTSSSTTTNGASSSASTTSTTTSTTTTSATTSSSTSGSGGAGGATSSATTASSSSSSGTGGSPPGLPLGQDCTKDSDCDSNLCKPVVIGVNPVCVTPCTQQSDCGISTNFFCEPITAGATGGYCIPHSPAHCLSCSANSDCGSLSEVCFQAPGDVGMACHIDCSMSQGSACPQDYSCVDETVNGQARKLCRPNVLASCLDALGGYCDRFNLPQPCARTNTAGMCVGQRTCLPAKRFDKCNATAPQCKTDCSMQDPAGCTETFCASATNTPANCGSCGNACPGYLKTSDNVTCSNGTTCTFSCQGEHYDVNGNAADGCEASDSPTANHAQSAATDIGDISDCDSGNNKQFSFSGHILSDKRAHATPAVTGFVTGSGSAPDWFKMRGVPSFPNTCANDIVAQLCVTGSSSPACYRLTVITDQAPTGFSCQTNASGCCPNQPNDSSCTNEGICQNDGGHFTDNSEIYFEVQKTCTTSVTENVSYTVTGHL